MVLRWYECEICHVEYPHEDEAYECEHRHGKKMIEIYYGGDGKGMSMASLNDTPSGQSGISGIDGWTGVESRKKRKRR